MLGLLNGSTLPICTGDLLREGREGNEGRKKNEGGGARWEKGGYGEGGGGRGNMEMKGR